MAVPDDIRAAVRILEGLFEPERARSLRPGEREKIEGALELLREVGRQ